MKRIKAIMFILLFKVIFCLNFSFALTNFPLTDPKWEGKSYKEIFLDLYEDAFLDLYTVTEANLDSIEAFNAFRLMKTIYSTKGLNKKLVNNEIVSSELTQLLSKLIKKTENPQNAKDYFYRGLFVHPLSYQFPKKTDRHNCFIHIIDNFPDTIYAKYSYILLAGDYMINQRGDEAIQVLNNYNAKYTENSKLSLVIDGLFMKLNYRSVFNIVWGWKAEVPKETAEEIAMNEVFLQYANKILNEHPEKKDITGDVLLSLGNYYQYHMDYTKAMEYYNQVYNDPGFNIVDINRVIFNIIGTYKKRSKISELNTFLEDVKSRYFQNKGIRKHYKATKLIVIEIQSFGYDKYDRSKANMQLYDQKKTEIEQFREQYEQSWDENYNLIKQLPEPPAR
jgi:hypothetical protein